MAKFHKHLVPGEILYINYDDEFEQENITNVDLTTIEGKPNLDENQNTRKELKVVLESLPTTGNSNDVFMEQKREPDDFPRESPHPINAECQNCFFLNFSS